MNPRDFFPLGKAFGTAFCNRSDEQEWLQKNIHAGKHSLIIAPRRFGKSSLIDLVISHSGLPTITLNFNTCADEQDLEHLIRQGVTKLIGLAIGTLDKALHTLKNQTQFFTPRVILGSEHMQLELVSQSHHHPAEQVTEALNILEKLLAQKKQRAVLVLDEFQTVGQLAKGKGVEAAIRNSAQSMKYLAIIFSGSHRGLLQTMFEDANRPLYKLCRKLNLPRIEATHYRPHLNKAAKAAWSTHLAEEVFARIMQRSQRHPYFVNYLCDIVWTECNTPPTIQAIDACWHLLIEEEKSDINLEIANLSPSQRKVLKFIAQEGGYHLMATATVKKISLALSSISGAINSLIAQDIIEKEEHRLTILNPAIEYYLSAMGNS